jgi:hypothetical protein
VKIIGGMILNGIGADFNNRDEFAIVKIIGGMILGGIGADFNNRHEFAI